MSDSVTIFYTCPHCQEVLKIKYDPRSGFDTHCPSCGGEIKAD